LAKRAVETESPARTMHAAPFSAGYRPPSNGSWHPDMSWHPGMF